MKYLNIQNKTDSKFQDICVCIILVTFFFKEKQYTSNQLIKADEKIVEQI